MAHLVSLRSITIIGVVVAAILLGSLMFRWQTGEEPVPEQANAKATSAIGITYISLNTRIAHNYGLNGIESGALVTEVISGSSAAKAGVQVGDIIIGFNGAQLADESSLYGIISACQPGKTVAVEVIRAQKAENIELLHLVR